MHRIKINKTPNKIFKQVLEYKALGQEDAKRLRKKRITTALADLET